ncbi:VWA domain-containing protein [Rathayibacter sp. CAU 1779]
MRKLVILATAVAVLVTTFVVFAPAAQAAVPPATGNNAVITVKAGSDRNGTSAVSNLEGVVLGFYDTAGSDTPVFTCTSDANGDCSITVPDTQTRGTNRDRRFFVRQISAPTGYYMNSTLAIGTTPASSAYTFQTGTQLRNGTTYSSLVNFMIGTGNTTDTASGGIWQDSRTNPVLPPQCGLNVAIVADLSNSVTATDLVALKGAASTMVNALTGTPSTMSLFTFATNSPAAGAANVNRPGLMPVSTAAGAAAVNGMINGWALPGGAEGGTNWDQAFQSVANSTQHYDVVVVITDGNPTYYGNPVQGPGNRTRFREVENGTFSANAVKAQDTRIVAMGVGAGVAGSPDNLRAISGQTAGSDYYQESDYTAAGAALRTLALGNCAGSLTVVKEVVPPGTPANSTTGAQPAGGWTFGAATATTGVTIDPASGETADGTGAVNFALTFTGTTTADLTVNEMQQAGYTLHTINGDNAVCTRVDTGANVPITNAGTGFSVTASSDFPVSCTVYNLAPIPPATLQVSKQWVVDGVTFPEGEQPAELTTHLQLDGAAADWSTVQTGFSAGQTVSIDEEATVDQSSLCTISSQLLTTANGTPTSAALPFSATLQAGANTYQITNVVTCPASLTLEKDVLDGPAAATEWTLNAAAPGGALPGPSGTTGVTGAVTPSVTYALSESGGDPRYAQVADPNAVAIPGSTVSWFCNQIDPTTGDVIAGFSDGLNGGVTIPPGFDVRCQARNQSAQLTLVKAVDNTHGGLAQPGDWTLTADPGDNDFGLTAESVTGSTAGASLWLRPGQTYTLSESGPDGYDLGSLECRIGNSPVFEAPSDDTITLLQNQYAVCTFTNVDRPAHLTLVKEVHNVHGGTATASDWDLSATGPTDISGASGSDAVTNAPVSAGTYTLAESGPSGYTASAWSCTNATVTGSTVAVAFEADVTCTITNTDQALPPVEPGQPGSSLAGTGSNPPWPLAVLVALGGAVLILIARRRRT